MRRKKRHHLLAFFIELFFILILLLLALWLYEYSRMQHVTVKEEEVLFSLPEEAEKAQKGTLQIAFFGVDSREGDLTSGTRSDVIMLVTRAKGTRQLDLTSIYRDTYLSIDESHGYSKINHAYAYGGPALSLKALNQNLDLALTDFVTVNFNSLAGMVDALGGIQIEIKEDELDQVNRYARDVAKILGVKTKKIKKAGLQTLDGAQATGYCRVRYTEGGDFRRTSRQRTVLQAILSKCKRSGPIRLFRLVHAAAPLICTSLGPFECIKLGFRLITGKIGDTTGFPSDPATGYVGKANCVFASDSLEKEVAALHLRLFGLEDYTPSKRVRSISDTIQSRR